MPDGACAGARSNSGFSLVPRKAWRLSLGWYRLLSSYLVHMIKSYPSAITPSHQSIPKALAILHLSHLELTCTYATGLYSIPFLLPFRYIIFGNVDFVFLSLGLFGLTGHKNLAFLTSKDKITDLDFSSLPSTQVGPMPNPNMTKDLWALVVHRALCSS